MNDQDLKISWIIPLYQDAGHLKTAFERSLAFLQRLGCGFEIILVNDGSTDQTAEAAQRLAAEHRFVRVLHHLKNRGYGAALNTGFQAARGQWIGYTDGDAQYDPMDLFEAVNALRVRGDDHGPLAIFGRKRYRCDNIARKIQSRVYNRLLRLFLGISNSDSNCSLKVFPASVFPPLGLLSRSAFVDAEIILLMEKSEVPVQEVPVRHFFRGGGKSGATQSGFGAKPSIVLPTIRDLFRTIRARSRI